MSTYLKGDTRFFENVATTDKVGAVIDKNKIDRFRFL